MDKVKRKVGKDWIVTLPWDNNSWEVAAQIAVQHHRARAAFMTGESRPETPLPLRDAAEKAQLLLQAVVVPGERTDDGKIIEAVTIPWFDIIAMLERDPNVAFEIPPEKWEEIIAGAYRRVAPLIPARLQLVDGTMLMERLKQLGRKPSD